MEIEEIRRINLLHILEEGGRGYAKELADLVGCEPSYLSQIKTKKKNMGSTFARQVEQGIKQPKGWFDALHTSDYGIKVKSLLNYGVGKEIGQRIVSEAFNELAQADGQVVGRFRRSPREESAPSVTEFVDVPYYREAAFSAGAGSQIYDEDAETSLTFQTSWLQQMGLRSGELCVIRCRGDSMEPRIHDGDVILIDKASRDVQDSAVYAINYAGEAKLKRLFKKLDGSVLIKSDNPKYGDEVVPASEDMASQLNIIGKAVWIGGTI